ncbi:MAG: ATP-binding protein, partial [Candidatus Cryptobacteroides sp.]
MENKPFIFGVATSGDNFTDREKETERLLMNFRHGINTILISPRRWGKTSLVKKVCRLAESDKLKVVYLDIFSCRSEKEFYDAFAAAVLKQTSSKFSISLEMNPKNNEVDEILQLPEK